MFCKSLPVQTSPEAPVQKNAAAGGSTQTLLRQGPTIAARRQLRLRVAEEMRQPRETGSPSPGKTLSVSSDLQKKDQEEKKGKGGEEGTDRHHTRSSAHLEITNWASSLSQKW